MVAVPPIITAVLPDYAGSIAPLPLMLVGTYALCLSPPAGQFLLTIHKQVPVLFIAVPAMVLALAAAYAGAAKGLVGVASGVAFASLVYCVAVNLYAFSSLRRLRHGVRLMSEIGVKAAVALALVWAIVQVVPPGPPPLAWVGGWRLLASMIVVLPLVAGALRRVRALSEGPPADPNPAVLVDNSGGGH
jgi:O-antigen/teichoic acid export membrane protein